jgi:hypothetical protein
MANFMHLKKLGEERFKERKVKEVNARAIIVPLGPIQERLSRPRNS